MIDIQRVLLDIMAMNDTDYNRIIGELDEVIAHKRNSLMRIRRQYKDIPVLLQPINKKVVLDIHFLLNFKLNLADYMHNRNNAESRV